MTVTIQASWKPSVAPVEISRSSKVLFILSISFLFQHQLYRTLLSWYQVLRGLPLNEDLLPDRWVQPRCRPRSPTISSPSLIQMALFSKMYLKFNALLTGILTFWAISDLWNSVTSSALSAEREGRMLVLCFLSLLILSFMFLYFFTAGALCK